MKSKHSENNIWNWKKKSFCGLDKHIQMQSNSVGASYCQPLQNALEDTEALIEALFMHQATP